MIATTNPSCGQAMAALRKVRKNFFVRRVLAASLLAFILLLQAGAAFAQQDGGIDKSPVVTSLTGTALAPAAYIDQAYTNGNEQSRIIKNIISFSIREDAPAYIPEDFSATISLTIGYGRQSHSEQQVQQALTISYKKAEGLRYDARKLVSFDSARYVRVTIDSISYSAATLSNGTDVRVLLLLENEMRVTCYYQLAASGNTPAFGQRSATADELRLSWVTPAAAGNNGVQLEWTWLQHAAQAAYINSNGSGLNLAQLFRNNATRIDLPYGSSDYSIPLLYEDTGTLYYRIRAVNLKASGSRTDGPWSAADSFAFGGHSQELNWQVSTSFAEEGKRKTVVQYFDGSLRSRQTVTKDNTNNTILSAETLYDGQGRPAVQILPAPGISAIVAYTKQLNRFNGQDSANTDPALFFDLEPLSPPAGIARSATAALATSSGASRYYSPANPLHDSGLHRNIPDAEGHPYSVTRYTPDGTGRIMSQSGVGDALKMGSTHETKYYYGTAAQEELDGLFGTEAGNASHYAKNMVKDANGQMSVSYVDMQGRTVATALAGDAPAAVAALPLAGHYPNQSGSAVTRNLLDRSVNTVRGSAVEAVSTLLVPATTSYTFLYKLTPAALQLARCSSAVPLSYDCMYNLEFSVTDESGEVAPVVKKFNNVSADADDTAATGVQPMRNDTTLEASNEISFTLTLLPGSYSIRKTLGVSEASLERYREMYLQKALCKTQQELTDSVYAAMLAVSDCNAPPPASSCQACMDSVGTYSKFRSKYMQGYDTSSYRPSEAVIRAAYSADSSSCRLLCPGVSHRLQAMRSIMTADMIPFSGQYAQASAPSGSGDMYNKYDIFAASDPFGKLYYRKPLNADLSAGYYYDAFHNIDASIYPDASHSTTRLDQITPAEFASTFSYSWAESLLPHHPEYFRLNWAEKNLGPSYNWIEGFSQAGTFDQASAGGYLLDSASFGSNPADPFFSLPSSRKDSMRAFVTGSCYYGGTSLWQMAYSSVVCRTLTNQADIDQCHRDGPKQPPFAGLTTAQKDQVWLAFRGMYAAVRDSFVTARIQEWIPLSDQATLIQRGYILRFATASQTAAQAPGWSQWYPATPGGAPPASAVALAAGMYRSQCSGYIDSWKQSLLGCPALAAHNDKEAILSEITALMQAVCEKGADAANPDGASTVNPASPQNGSLRSFEEVVDSVLRRKYGIARDQYCNPYVISYPKPYNKGPVFTRSYTAAVDTCMCSQFALVKAAAASQGYDSTSRSSLNIFLAQRYGDTLSQQLFSGLQQCAQLRQRTCEYVRVDTATCNDCVVAVCRDTVTSYQLSEPQVQPRFLLCGFRDGGQCLSCDSLVSLISQFKAIFTDPFNRAPLFDSPDLSADSASYNGLLARFLNFRTGLSLSWQDYAAAATANECSLEGLGSVAVVLCQDSRPAGDTTGLFATLSPCQQVYDQAEALAAELFQIRKRQLLSRFELLYRSRSLAAQEEFQVSYTTKEYHYTLYYYDQAGNLVRTVPPKGVRPNFDSAHTALVKAARAAGNTLRPAHELATDYRYNSLNQVVEQATPDAGMSRFWYDRLGRLAVSRNAQQSLDSRYSYTLYDDLGRITEVGQKPQSAAMSQAVSQDAAALTSWLMNGAAREQLTQTVYDTISPFIQGVMLKSAHLRGRVSYSRVKDLSTDHHHRTATFYSYDVHGNVDTLLQDYGGLLAASDTNHFKRIVYNYDLVSGKVNQVNYQPGGGDGYRHRYEYDAENRLTAVWTSRDGLLWERDGSYQYYRHGPLGRMVVGHQQVQGLDYRYTLQGWLKGVNGLADAGSAGTDSSGSCQAGTAPDDLVVSARPLVVPPQLVARSSIEFRQGFESQAGDSFETLLDASLGVCQSSGSGGGGAVTYPASAESFPVARDAAAFSLHYYGQDYKAISSSAAPADALTALGSQAAPLYNGNIAAMAVNVPKVGQGLLYNYRYDQLNRLVSMDAYKGLDAAGSFTPVSVQDYQERVGYDPNGNILTYLRNGTLGGGRQLAMDSMQYHYTASTNRLSSISDQVAAGKYTEDIDSQAEGNYRYDAIGNLKSDSSQLITNIDWTVYGKIAGITKAGVQITYSYDASGNRVLKVAGGITTLYVRDASGNVMSVYERQGAAMMEQKEVHLYGSSRLGIVSGVSVQPVAVNVESSYGQGKVSTFTRGEKLFEVSNHLGNVLATVADRRTQHTSGGAVVDYYQAEVVSATDYAPFGMGLVGRTYNSGSYRFNFNGKESDSETSTQDYGMRIYDPRVARFLSVDPLSKDFPWYTPYQFAGNMPISAIDLDGCEPKSAIENWTSTKEYKNYQDYYNNGSNLQKVEGFWVNSYEWSSGHTDYKWYNSSGGKEGKGAWEVFEPTHLPTPKSIFDRIQGSAELGGKLTLGPQASVNAKLLGTAKLKAEVNIGSVELVSGNAGYNPGGLTAGAWDATGDYIGRNGETRIKQSVGIGVTAKVPFTGNLIPELGVGGNYQNNINSYSSGGITEKSAWDATIGIALKSKSADEMLKELSFTDRVSVTTTPQLKFDLGKKKTFYGIDLGTKAALGLGIEVNLKFGFYFEDK